MSTVRPRAAAETSSFVAPAWRRSTMWEPRPLAEGAPPQRPYHLGSGRPCLAVGLVLYPLHGLRAVAVAVRGTCDLWPVTWEEEEESGINTSTAKFSATTLASIFSPPLLFFLCLYPQSSSPFFFLDQQPFVSSKPVLATFSSNFQLPSPTLLLCFHYLHHKAEPSFHKIS